MISLLLVFGLAYLFGLQQRFTIENCLREQSRDRLRVKYLLLGRRGDRRVHRAQFFALLLAFVFAGLWFYTGSWRNLSILTLLLLLWAAARVDFQRGIVPDGVTLVGVLLGLFFSSQSQALHNSPLLLFPIDSQMLAYFSSALLGLFIASGTLLWIAIFFEKISGHEGLGFGDVKLAGLLGAFLGYRGAIHVFIYGAWIALVAEILRFLLARQFTRRRRIPFAPYLALGTVIYLWRLSH